MLVIDMGVLLFGSQAEGALAQGVPIGRCRSQESFNYVIASRLWIDVGL
jgi:hypothetical protein